MVNPVMSSSERRVPRVLRTVDGAVLGWTGLFVLWIAVGNAPPTRAGLIDLAFFAPLGLLVSALMAAAGQRAAVRRDRVAWWLLALSVLLRVSNGAVWRLWNAAGETAPAWSNALSIARSVTELVALTLFVSARRAGRDRLRWLLDLALVILGVSVIEGYFAGRLIIADLLLGAGVARHPAASYTVLLTGAASALLSALLHLRRGDAPMRLAALLLLAAYTMQALPDTLQWGGSAYQPGEVITLWWWAIWLAKLAAVRVVLGSSAAPDPAATAPYRSGVLPYLLLAGVSVLLWFTIDAPHTRVGTWLSLALGAITLLLLARQLVEARDQRALSEALEADRAWFSALLKHSYDAVALFDVRGGLMYATPATYEAVGSASDAPLTAATMLGATHPEDRRALQDALDRPPSDDQRVTCRLRGVGGRWRVFELRFADLREHPRVRGVLVHGHDTTRAARLARRLHEGEEVEALGVFAGGLSHDLNNVLSVIGGHAALLLQDVPADSAAATELRAVQAALERGAGLTQSLLALSRRKTPHVESVEVESFLRAHVPAGTSLLVESGLRVRVDADMAGRALEAVLGAEAPSAGAAVSWRLAARTVEVGPEAGTLDDLTAGTYVRVTCERSAGGTASTGGAWEEGLEIILARALMRELGGALRRERTVDGSTLMNLFVPARPA